MDTPDSTSGTAYDYSTSAPPPLPPSPAPAPRRERSGCFRGCLIAAVILFVLAALFIGLCAWLYSIGSKELSKVDSDDDFTAAASGLHEVWSCDYGIPTEDESVDEPLKAIRIPLTGTIDLSAEETGFFGSSHNPTAFALRAIRRATEDDTVNAILLEVDSGGGGITASDILYHELMLFKEADPKRKIVVLMGDMACSGAYYASLPADCILAHPTTLTGSIGVLLPAYNVRQLADKLGIVDDTIQSGENKTLLSPTKDLTDEQRAILQGTVDELYGRFAELVSKHRGIPVPALKTIADGRIYTARQALDLKLIDGIGYEADALDTVFDELGSPSGGVEFYHYERKNSFRDLFSSPEFWGKAFSHAISTSEVPTRSPRLRLEF